MAHKQNYTARMELNRQHRLSAGLLSDRFPDVSAVVIRMTYYQKGINPVLMERTVNVLPSDSAYFNMECMVKDCVDGGFDLTAVISDMVRAHKKTERGKLVCSGKADTIASDHASIAYEIGIQYNRHPR